MIWSHTAPGAEAGQWWLSRRRISVDNLHQCNMFILWPYWWESPVSAPNKSYTHNWTLPWPWEPLHCPWFYSKNTINISEFVWRQFGGAPVTEIWQLTRDNVVPRNANDSQTSHEMLCRYLLEGVTLLIMCQFPRKECYVLIQFL